MKKLFSGALAYFWLNTKSILVEKVSMLWSVSLPLILFYMNRGGVDSLRDLSFYWCNIVVTSYVFGLGIYAVEMRESGCLKTVFSIYRSKAAYIFGNFLTQLIYITLCVSVFNLFVVWEKGMDFWVLERYSLYTICMCLPFGIGSYGISLMQMFYISTMKTIVSVLFFFGFVFCAWRPSDT